MSGEHKHTEEELRYTARRYPTAVGLKAAGVEIANATLAARSEAVWGQGTTTVASDSTHFKAWDRNIFTEWHSRYGAAACSCTGTSKRVRWPFTASF